MHWELTEDCAARLQAELEKNQREQLEKPGQTPARPDTPDNWSEWKQ